MIISNPEYQFDEFSSEYSKALGSISLLKYFTSSSYILLDKKRSFEA